MFTLDTNAVIYYLKGEEKVFLMVEDILENNLPLYVSVVTELELLSFSSATEGDNTSIEQLLSVMSIIPLDSRLARLAASLRRKYRLKTPDSVIAATALFTGTGLLTRNIKDFARISEITVRPV